MDVSQLSTVDEGDGTPVILEDVNGDPIPDSDDPNGAPLTMLVAGTYSEAYRAAEKRETARAIRAGQKRGRSGVQDSDIDDLDDAVLRKQVACILAWPFKSGGKPFPITLANWKALLAQQPQWRAQVHEAMHDHARFFTKS